MLLNKFRSTSIALVYRSIWNCSYMFGLGPWALRQGPTTQDSARCRAEKNLRHVRHGFRWGMRHRRWRFIIRIITTGWFFFHFFSCVYLQSQNWAELPRRDFSTFALRWPESQARKGRNWRSGPLESTPYWARWEPLLCHLEVAGKLPAGFCEKHKQSLIQGKR